MKPVRFKKVAYLEKISYYGIITLEDLQKKFNIPEGARVTVQVPGGGDYSNTKLEIGTDVDGIEVRWEVIK
jgi:hypothetical protein